MHVIIGAGPLGRSVAQTLVERGGTVRLASRRGDAIVEGAEPVRADATVATDLDAALTGATVVYQCSQPAYTKWAAEFPSLQRTILDATVRVGADLVIADNLYMYGDPEGGVVSEASAEHPHTRKGAVRKQMADDALAAHREGRLRVAISRPSDYFGPGHDQTSKGVFGNAVRGRAMQFFGRMDQPHSFAWSPDAAAAMATLGTSDAGWGAVWIPPTQPAMTQQDFAAAVWSAAGRSGAPRTAVVGRRALAALGLVVPIVREVAEMSYLFEKPFVVDSSRFERTFGVAPTPFEVAVERTVAHYRG